MAGWTCSCLGRTHVCPLRNLSSMVIDQYIPGSNNTRATCYTRSVQSADKPSLKLGGWNMSLSRTGMLQNSCTQIRWFLNGVEMASFGKPPIMSAENLDDEIDKRGINSLYEFRAGDLLAFQFLSASYYCHLSHFVINVDGSERVLTNSNSSDVIRFARKFSMGWNQPWFIPVLGTDEYNADSWHFVPLRPMLFSSGAPIIPGIDYWLPDDGTRDHESTNFYFRVLL